MNAYLILGTIGVLIFLIYVFKFYEMSQMISQFMKNQNGDNSNHNAISEMTQLIAYFAKNQHGTNFNYNAIAGKDLFDIEEYQFYDKFVNVAFTEARTVTLANAFYEILKNDHHAITPSEEEGKGKMEQRIEKGKGTLKHYGDLYKLNPKFLPYEKMQFDVDQLRQLEDDHEKRLCEIVGRNNLGKLCICEGGLLCKWDAKVITQFLIHKRWNVTNIKIYAASEEGFKVISISDKSVCSPRGDYIFMSMSNPRKIKSLAPETVTYIVFTLEVALGEYKCAVLKNIIPDSPDNELVKIESGANEKNKGNS